MIHRIVTPNNNSETPDGGAQKGSSITNYLPRTVELHEMRTPVRRMFILFIEFLVGLLVVGGFLFGLFYIRLEKGDIDLNFVVPSIESAINEQLLDLSVKIDSAFVGKNTHSAGVHFRLRNIVLYNKSGEAIANAPFAAVDLNGRALMWGRIAPSQVVFIKPTLEIAHSEGKGISLSYTSNNNKELLGENKGRKGDRASAPTPLASAAKTVDKIDFMKAVTAAFEEARSHRNSSSYLTQFGVRDALVRLSMGNARYSWKVPDFIIDLKHSDTGSLIRGFGKLGVGEKNEEIEPWKLRFQTRQFEDTKDLQLDVGFKDITPISLHRLLPELSSLKLFNIPFSGKINAKLNSLGELQGAFANIHLAAGKILVPWLSKEDGIEGLNVNVGDLKLAYSRKGEKLHLLPSPITWGDNQTTLSGVMEQVSTAGSGKIWNFTFKGSDTRLAANDFDLGPMIIDEWWIAGSINPGQGLVEIAGFYLKAGNARINVKGVVKDIHASSPAIFLEGKVSSISVPIVKRLWPTIVAVDARDWVGTSIQEGQVVSGDFKVAIPTGTIAGFADGGDLSPDMVQLNLVLSDMLVKYHDDLIPLAVPEARLKISGRQLTVDVPKGRMHFSQKQLFRISHASYTIPDLRDKNPESDLSFRVAGRARELFSFVNQPAFGYSRQPGIASDKIEGNVQGVISMHIPLAKDVKFKDIALTGDLRLKDMKSKKLFAGLSIDAGTVNIKVNEKAVGANGGIVVKGIPVGLHWQHIFGATTTRQPPIRLSAVLGKSSRQKLGLATLDRYMSGDVPVVMTVAPNGRGLNEVQVRADLTNSRINNTAIGWSKPPGTAAVLQFDVENTQSDITELRNFNLVGNQLVLEGVISVNGKTNRMEAFSFPKISYDQIDSMSLVGIRKNNDVFGITANVKSFNGMRLLRKRFFSNAQPIQKARTKSGNWDFDLTASIDTVIGGKGAHISGATVDIKKRGGKLTWLDFHGRLNGRSMLAIVMEQNQQGKRVLKVESKDAGSSLKMIGLYPNIQGGHLSLLVDMDPKGTTEKTGTLWIKDFDVISTQSIDKQVRSADVFGSNFIGGSNKHKTRGRPKLLRTKMEFDQLKAPFSFGDGQFILHNSYVNGPVIGATLRGKIDFRTETMKLGGTYVPLYGLNSAIGEIPVLSDLLVGRRGEGVFGVTFAIEGPTKKPTVIVNPVSLLTPGVFRQIFDFNNSVKNRQFHKLPKARQKIRARRFRRGTNKTN